MHFSYDSGAPVLNGATLTVHPGERIAIAGPSGGGKSTLLRLLLRLDEPQCGEIHLGSTPLHDVARSDVHAHMALFSQDSPVFIDTIRNNLRIARPLADDEALWEPLSAARLDSFVATLPDGLDALVGEAGRTLSTGQMRRLCLARTLLSNAPIILLDEPTNALDPPRNWPSSKLWRKPRVAIRSSWSHMPPSSKAPPIAYWKCGMGGWFRCDAPPIQ